MDTAESIFTRDGELFLPTDRAQGAWGNGSLHGGPVAALLAHALESERPEGLMTSRIAFDLMRPVPMAPLAIAARVTREGKRIRYVDAAILAGDQVVARASAVMQRVGAPDAGEVSLPEGLDIPRWQDVPRKPWMNRPDERVRYHTGVEVRIHGQPYQGQLVTIWAHVPYALFPGHALTPVEQAAALSDFGNGINLMSRTVPEAPFINSEITLYLHREPVGDWLCLECTGRGDRDGLVSSVARLHDETGFCGHAGIAGMANPLPPGLPPVSP